MQALRNLLPSAICVAVVSACTSVGQPSPSHPFSLDAAAVAKCTSLATTDFAFTSTADGDSEIYLFRAARGDIRQLTDQSAQDHWASWAPDGKTLAFQTLRDGNREVYLLDVASGEVSNISNHPEQDLLPAWSPDGRFLAFFSSRARPWEGTGPLGGHIYLWSAENGDLQQLETAPFLSTATIAWAPDGSAIAYTRYEEGREGIYLFELSSGIERLVLPASNAIPAVTTFAGDNQSLFYYLESDSGSHLWSLDLQSGRTVQVSSGDGGHYYASVSDDSRFLLTTSQRNGTEDAYDIRCMSVDGSVDVTIIGGPGDARSAAWRPAGGPD